MDFSISNISLLLIIVIGLLSSLTDAQNLTCYQCNVYVRGTPWRCEDADKPMHQRSGCFSCLKTYTRSYLHNTFHDQILTEYNSRLCMQSTEYDREDGCYPHVTDAGYQKYCYCHTNLCNSGRNSKVTLATTVLMATVSLALRSFL